MNLSSFENKWTGNRIKKNDGKTYRLLKMYGNVEGIDNISILTQSDVFLDEEEIPSYISGPWDFGFWINEDHIEENTFKLKIESSDKVFYCDIDLVKPPKGDALPLRLDKLGNHLLKHMNEREIAKPCKEQEAFVPDISQYLYQHRIIYKKPAENWSEGLILGNGNIGAIITGEKNKSQKFYLDKCDLWGTTPKGMPIGRFYGGEIEIEYKNCQQNNYLQVLFLDKAQIETVEGMLKTTSYVNANHDVLEVKLQWRGETPLDITVKLKRPPLSIIEEYTRMGSNSSAVINNGSWAAVKSNSNINDAKKKVSSGPFTTPELIVKNDTAFIYHELENISSMLACNIDSEKGYLINTSPDDDSMIVLNTLIPAKGEVVIYTFLSSDRSPKAFRKEILLTNIIKQIHDYKKTKKYNETEHIKWWENFWGKSFIEMPDKYIENLWYFGLYHQAGFSRSLDAPGFLALWHPLDHRTWHDCYVADAQTSLMWWAPFATNHIELMLPSHNTFGNLMVEFMEHNSKDGAFVTHAFYPDWAGGHISFGGDNKNKGSVAWMGINFWWDYLFTKDDKLLKWLIYPVLSLVADWHRSDLVLLDDGCLHSLNSQSPEQFNTDTDNIYDRVMIEAVMKAAIEAAKILGIDEERVKAWEYVLTHLYPIPQNDEYILETDYNHHPYRCHPAVLFALYPSGCVEPGNPLWLKAINTYRMTTKLYGFNYEDRKVPIPGFDGGVEPNAHATAFLLHYAARLFGWQEIEKLCYGVLARTQLKNNCLRSISDPRHDELLTNMAISEGVSGQTSGISEVFVQNYSDHVRVFEAIDNKGVFRFAGLRAYGGFVLSGQCKDGIVDHITVYSILGETITIKNPWDENNIDITPKTEYRSIKLADNADAIEIKTIKGEKYLIKANNSKLFDIPKPCIETREEPRKIRIRSWDEYVSPIIYYPEDLPYAQNSASPYHVYIGMPDEGECVCEPEQDIDILKEMLKSADWKFRQTAARLLGKIKTKESTDLLKEICISENESVVIYTAGVNMINHMTEYSWLEALKVAKITKHPFLKREILKKISRMLLKDEGQEVLTEIFRNINNIDIVI